jgi:hypothetical protein
MRNDYESTSSNRYVESFSQTQINNQCQYLWGITKDLLHKKEEGYPFLDNRIQSVIDIVSGHNVLFNYSSKVVTICSLLETARRDECQFRKCILDSMGLIDELRNDFISKGGDSYV